LLEKLKSIDPAVLTELSFSTRRTATTPDVSGFADGFHDHFHDHVEKEM
jgi:acyl dehydratase